MMSNAWQGYQLGKEVNIAEIVKEHSSELLERVNEQNPAWSEEDDYVIERLFCLLDNEQDNYPQLSSDFQEIEEIKNWLESLKDRVQPKQEWSEEDKTIIESLIALCDDKIKTTEFTDVKEHAEKCKHWLKSLRQKLSIVERNGKNWRPTKEQIIALEDAIEFLGCTKKVREYLKSLYEQLKAL